jgi:preprotein translocase subunit SecG
VGEGVSLSWRQIPGVFGMYMLFVILHILVSVVLSVAVLLQSSKGGGLAGAFGGAGGAPQQILGSRGMTTLLHKVTIWCGIGFMVTSLSLFMMSGSQNRPAGSVLENAQEQGVLQPDSPAPPIQEF